MNDRRRTIGERALGCLTSKSIIGYNLSYCEGGRVFSTCIRSASRPGSYKRRSHKDYSRRRTGAGKKEGWHFARTFRSRLNGKEKSIK